MKYLLFLTLTLFTFVNISCAQEIKLDENVTLEGAVKDETIENILREEKLEGAVEEEPQPPAFERIFGRISDFTDYEPKNRFIEKIDIRANYRGSTIFQADTEDDNDLRTNYKFNAMEVGTDVFFGDKRTKFTAVMNLAREVDGAKRFWEKLSDVYISRNLDDIMPFLPGEATLTVGHSRPAIGVEGSQSEFSLLTVDRAQISKNFGNYRAMGAKLQGKAEFYDYNIGVFDSTRYFNEPFDGAEFTGWINVKPLAKVSDKYGKLTLGSGISTGEREHQSYTVFGAGASWEYKNLLVNFEYANANGYNSAWYNGANAQGLYSTVAYKVHPKVQLVGRFDMFDPDIYENSDIKTEYTVGINYYILQQKVKLVLNYVFSTQEQEASTNKILLMTQFML